MKIDEVKKINKSLESIIKEFETKIKGAQDQLDKTNKEKDSKTYGKIQEELQRRKEELETVKKQKSKLNEEYNDIKSLNIEDLKKNLEKKENTLKRAKEKLDKLNQNKDKKLYQEIQEEIRIREKELKEAKTKLDKANKDIEAINEYCKKISEKYHIEIIEKNKKQKNNQSNEKNTNKSKDITKKINEKREEIKKIEKIMSNIGSKGFDGSEYLEKYKKLMKELEDLKEKQNSNATVENNKQSEQKNKRKIFFPTEEEIKQYYALRKEGYDDNSPEIKEFLNKIVKDKSESENSINNKGIEYPPVVRKSQDLPANEEKIKDYDDEDDDLYVYEGKEKEAEPELSIIYNGKDNTYTVKNFESIVENLNYPNEEVRKKYIKEIKDRLSKPIKGRYFKNKKAKMKYLKEEFTERDLIDLFGEKYEKKMKKIIKKCDPQLMTILGDVNMEYLKKYIHKISSKEYDSTVIPYNMTYNMKDTRKNKKTNKLSFWKRRKINNMARVNFLCGVAEYIPDNMNKGLIAIPIVGALAAGGWVAAKQCEVDKDAVKDNSNNITNSNPDKEETKENGNIGEIPEAVNQLFESTVKNNSNDLSLGSKVRIEDGVTYAEDSLQNGQKGVIGEVSWRPAGDYTIDRVALYYNGKMLENIGTEGTNVDAVVRKYAKDMGINPEEIVQKAHICMGEKHDGATGWLDMDEISMQDIKNNISKTYEEIKNERANNTNSQSKNIDKENER